MFMDILVLLTNVKKKLKEKLSLSDALKQTAMYVKIEVDRKRWITNTNGYLVCGTCYEKLGCEPICENFFCRICYASVEEYCSCSE